MAFVAAEDEKRGTVSAVPVRQREASSASVTATTPETLAGVKIPASEVKQHARYRVRPQPCVHRRCEVAGGPAPTAGPFGLRHTATRAQGHRSAVAGGWVGTDLAAESVPQQTREDLVNCTLFAQLAASGAVTDPKRIAEWYDAYFKTLTAIGWAQSDTQFEDYEFKSKTAEAHKAIIKVLTVSLDRKPRPWLSCRRCWKRFSR